jgi:hypothetical protein
MFRVLHWASLLLRKRYSRSLSMAVRRVVRYHLGLLVVAALFTGSVCAQPNAMYTVTFHATWNAGTHPTDFPANAHFSPLIGGTHNDSVKFWNPGDLASPGIQNMAEKGNISPLDAEIGEAISAGRAEYLLSGSGTSSPGSVSLEFGITSSHPLVTLVSMVAPSPDWFVGVTGLNLYRNGSWIDTTIQLIPWDAGTDDGGTFTSANSPSVPHVNISAITVPPFEGTPPLGTFTFTHATTSVREDPIPSTFVLQQNYPNPFNPSTTITYGLPRTVFMTLTVYNALGQKVKTLVDGVQGAGIHSVVLTGTDLVSGMYFYQLRAEEFVATRRLIVLK